MKPFQYKPLCEDDISLLYRWFQEPTINEWYARGKHWTLKDIRQKYLPRIRGEDDVPSFIIYRDNHPIGFIQYYYLNEHSLPEGIQGYDHPLFKVYRPNELAGLDLFLAQSIDRGQGLGVKVINDFLLEYLGHFRAVIVDPNRLHNQAIRCYEKAGFERSTYSEIPDYLIMIKENKNDKD